MSAVEVGGFKKERTIYGDRGVKYLNTNRCYLSLSYPVDR